MIELSESKLGEQFYLSAFVLKGSFGEALS